MPRAATARARSSQESSTSRLARFFQDAAPVRIPVRLTRPSEHGMPISETTIIEFGTPREVLFTSELPLEFADVLHLQNSDGTLDTDACVVALQYNGGRTVVAARFTQSVTNWIIKPGL